jgi:hypothetical protein
MEGVPSGSGNAPEVKNLFFPKIRGWRLQNSFMSSLAVIMEIALCMNVTF